MKNKYILIDRGQIAIHVEKDRLPVDGDLEGFCPESDEVFEFGDYVAAGIDAEDIERYGLRSVELRAAYGLLSSDEYAAAAKGAELLHWNRNMRYCPVCGGTMRRSGPISKTCTRCGKEQFPQLSPAIIVLVRRGDEALLVHAKSFKRPFFGLVAGFVETGESLEECVAREVMEETSLRVNNIKYFGSQSWPFPSQLMIGFTADYESGELCFADGELSSGGFFTRDNLPPIPTPPSIARRLIEAWILER